MALLSTAAFLASAALSDAPVNSAPVIAEICSSSQVQVLPELADVRPARATLHGLLKSDAISPGPGGKFHKGAAEVVAALAPADASWRWSVVRSGLSADGSHAFTAGYLDETAAGGKSAAFKFLAYWVRDGQGWRIASFRKLPAPQGERTAPAACLRSRSVIVSEAEAQRAELAAAEKRFSDEAQVIGLGPAFAKHGDASSLNLGTGSGLTLGSAAIGAEIGFSIPPPLVWSSDDVMVAPSGDLGLSWGVIRVAGDEKRRAAFFTVWHRAGPGEPWRYIAE